MQKNWLKTMTLLLAGLLTLGGCGDGGSLLQRGILGLAQVVCSCIDGHGHIGAGVAIGHGEHVQVIQLLLVDFDRRSRTEHQAAKISAVNGLSQFLFPPIVSRSSWNRHTH